MNLPTKFIQNILERAILQAYNLDLPDISIKFCYPNFDCDYTSPIAHQLSPKLEKSPQKIAQALCQSIPPNSKLAIAVTENGMLNFKLTATYMIECLEKIAIADLSLSYIPQPHKFPSYTHTQYAYTRCCSLLRQSIESKVLISELALPLIDIAENLNQLSEPQVIKHCQNLTINFLELSDRSSNSQVLSTSILKITQKLIYTLASGYINLPEYL